MWMDHEEIRISYRLAKDKKHQKKVLAQLNACSEKDIETVLQGGKVLPPFGTLIRTQGKNIEWGEENVDILRKYIESGMDYKTIAKTLDIPVTSVRANVCRFRLKRPKKEKSLSRCN